MRQGEQVKFFRLAVDFDNTCALNFWPNVGELIPGAKEYLNKLKDLGCTITIWSGRNSKLSNDPIRRAEGLTKMKEVLDREKIPYDDIDYGSEGKPLADLYVDDRALGAPLTIYKGHYVLDWPAAFNIIRLFILKKRLSL